MKTYFFPKVLLMVLLFGISFSAFAQVPQGIPYQAVARNSSGNILASQTIRVRFSIRDGVATGSIVYRETFTPTTNALGLFSVNVGTGTVVTGAFSGINWGTNAKFMQVEMDPTGGTTYTDMGTTQMMSVPYALYAGTSDASGQWITSGSHINNANIGNVGIGTSTPVARLHVADSSVVFTGPETIPTTPGNPPVSGSGGRMMWFADKAAFRTGYVAGTNWDKDSIGNFSFAAGRNTKASGTASVAMGDTTIASGFASTALGDSTIASGFASTAMGGYTFASNQFTTAIGHRTKATGIYGTATGYMTTAAGAAASAMGNLTFAGGDNSFAVGFSDSASGQGAIAIGNGVVSSGIVSSSIGYQTRASGDYSLATGRLTIASGEGSSAMGNRTIASGLTATAMGYTTYATGARSTAMGDRTTASGDNTTAMGTAITTNGKDGSFAIGDASPSTTTQGNDANNQMMMRFAGGYKLYTNSTITVGVSLAAGGNSWSTISDRRKKENFAAIDGEVFLKKILKFNLTSWNYKGQDPKIHRHYGPMAQDFYAAFGKDEYGTVGNDTTINQADMEGVSFVAIQALVKRTEELQRKVKALEAANHSLKTENTDLRAELSGKIELIEAELKKSKVSLR